MRCRGISWKNSKARKIAQNIHSTITMSYDDTSWYQTMSSRKRRSANTPSLNGAGWARGGALPLARIHHRLQLVVLVLAREPVHEVVEHGHDAATGGRQKALAREHVRAVVHAAQNNGKMTATVSKSQRQQSVQYATVHPQLKSYKNYYYKG